MSIAKFNHSTYFFMKYIYINNVISIIIKQRRTYSELLKSSIDTAI